ncbi:unnamed protein product [Lactuca saligna]|uniref:Pentacotripeptide-repeat region of PRORP domain-containing protein n=1 Tax=Lactuca saligna TaxID=75948 RepID=A0AA35YNX8_LACSI|nr:unnamed protein product [Lactuca saligna]
MVNPSSRSSHLKIVLVLPAKPKHVVSSVVSHTLNKFKDTSIAHSTLISSFSQFGTGIFTPKTISARFLSTSSCNRQTPVNHSRSISEKITNLDDALQLFDEMTKRKPLPAVFKFTELLQAVTKMKQYSCSVELFKRMNALGVPVNAYTISIVIKCCCQMHCTNEGFAVLGYGFKHNILPNVCTFSTLLNGLVLEDRFSKPKGLCKSGNNDTAIALLKLMDEKGCKPNVVTYNTIIDSLCKDKMVDDALNLFKEMVFHKGILPDVVTYTSLIHGLCNLCRWDEVDKILKEMEEQRISPNVHTFSILVDSLCKEGKVKDAKGVFNLMIQEGNVPNVVIYNSLIDGYCLRGEMSKAREVLNLMGSRGLLPNVVTYSSLMNGYCKKLKIEEAMDLFHEITKKGGMQPNVITYGIMIQGLFQAGRCEDACELFNEMRAHKLIPDETTYIIVLKGL